MAPAVNPADISAPLRPRARPRSGPSLKAVVSSASPAGVTAAVARPCNTLATSSASGEVAREWSGCVTEAVERGELPAGTDPDEVIRAVSAPLYYRLLASGDPLDEAAADRAAEAAAAAARAGAYVG